MAPFRPGDTQHDQRLPEKVGVEINPTRHYLGSGNGGRRTDSLPTGLASEQAPVEAFNAEELEGGSSPPLNSATDDPFHNDWKNW
jgi:hypothetical protein